MEQLFQSRAAMFTFILNYTDGENKSRLLGITPRMYAAKKFADRWREGILKAFEEDRPEGANEAIKELERIYKEMTA